MLRFLFHLIILLSKNHLSFLTIAGKFIFSYNFNLLNANLIPSLGNIKAGTDFNIAVGMVENDLNWCNISCNFNPKTTIPGSDNYLTIGVVDTPPLGQRFFSFNFSNGVACVDMF